jgi:hypothetical protein
MLTTGEVGPPAAGASPAPAAAETETQSSCERISAL